MDLSDDSSRGSTSNKSSGRSGKSRNGSDKGTNSSSKAKSLSISNEQIEQFIAVTGSTEDVARTLIEACRGNLEMAVNMHMEGLAENTGNVADEDYVRAPIPQKQEVLVQEGYESYGFSFKGKRKVTKSVFDSFRNFEVETKLQESKLLETNGQYTLSAPGASTSSGTSGKRSLEDLFRPPIDLIFKGNLQSARDAGKCVKKWLMVNIQNVSEFTCQVLNRDVWSNKAIKELVRENFVFLQLYMDSEEGQRYMNFYKVKHWPYVAVLDPRTGELMVEWNHADSSTYESLVNEFLATSFWGDEDVDRAAKPSEAKRRKLDTILDASEDDQIQAAIQASLAESRTNASASDSGSGDDEDEDGAADFFDSESDSRASEPLPKSSDNGATCSSNGDSHTAESASTNPTIVEPEEWRQHLGPETDPVSSIVFRFPDGSKAQQALPCTSTLMAVTKYVAGKGYSADKYELMANHPKRMLLAMDAHMTLKDVGLFPQDTVFVQSR